MHACQPPLYLFADSVAEAEVGRERLDLQITETRPGGDKSLTQRMTCSDIDDLTHHNR